MNATVSRQRLALGAEVLAERVAAPGVEKKQVDCDVLIVGSG
jgi:hypothetical protein